MSDDNNKPAINKNIYSVPKNPSKLKDARFNNKSVSKEKNPMYNPSLKKNVRKVKNPSMNKKYFATTEEDVKSFRLARMLLALFSGTVIIAIAIIGFMAYNKNSNMYKGEKYFEHLGISTSSSFKEVKDSQYDLVKVDSYYAGTFSDDGEQYYRFQVEKQGEKSYDLEVSSLQCTVSEEANIEKGYVEVFKRTYRSTSGEYSGKDVEVFYYKVHVPNGTLKTFQ